MAFDGYSDEPLLVVLQPLLHFGIVGRIPHNGTNVRVHRCRRAGGYRYKWCTITYNGRRGWAYARYLADMRTGRRPR